MLGNVEPTPFDLRFSLFGIPVRVHPLFWIVSAALGWHGKHLNLTLIWVVCVFFSILIHELGHALTAQAFGWPPHIVLYSFGGYASYTPTWGHTAGRSILVSFAGPGAGFLFYGVILAVEQLLIRQHVELSREGFIALRYLEFINLWWGLVNLLPVYPLDGGQISRAFFTHWRPSDGYDISLKLSLVIAAGVAFYLFRDGQMFNALLFGSLAFENLQSLQRGRFR
jgi:stage IV sporulation protein FB